jgi:hypothetical protein
MVNAIQVRAMDFRLASKLADQQPQDVIVTESMTAADAVSAIIARSVHHVLSRVTLISHGYAELIEGDTAPDHKMSVRLPGPANVSRSPASFSRIYGGYGLEFGSDDLNMGNVATFGRLRGRFTDGAIMVVFGCAAADKGPAIDAHLTGDGPGLMKALARHTGVPVRASDKLQEVPVNWYLGAGDRGAWAGRTFLFMPDGRQVDESALQMSVY